MNATDEQAALLAAIAAAPDDDTLRLVYADWLDEQGGDSNAARAELVRLQARDIPQAEADVVNCDPRKFGPAGRDLDALRARETALLAQYESVWRRGPVCEKCGGSGKERHDPDIAFRKRACTACRHTGDTGGLLRKFSYRREDVEDSARTWHSEPVRITRWSRGFPDRIEVPRLADALEQQTCPTCHSSHNMGCPTCHGRLSIPGDWQPTPWLAAVVRHHPVAECVCLDREPHLFVSSRDKALGWCRASNDNPITFGTAVIPDPIFNLMTDPLAPESAWRYFPTRDAAITALARAVVQFARRH